MNRRELLKSLGASGLATGALLAPRTLAAADDAPKADAPSGPPKLTVPELVRLLVKDGVSPVQVYGRQIEFTGTVLSIVKGIDGGRVPTVAIDGWDENRDAYGTAYVHNVIPDHVGQAGDRVKVQALIVEHGFGTLFLWRYRWKRLEG